MPFDPAAPDVELPASVGRYAIVRLLGEGSMGRVLLAHDPVLDRDVAVKHLRDDLKIPREVKKGLVTRMQHEARAAARVAHPNLVVLHDMGEDPTLGLYLVFEYVEGPTLKQRLAQADASPPGRLAPDEAARLARQLGGALTVAHQAGILHRDVKPENVILAKTGGKIADFGIARIPDSTLTHQGGLMGTPAYSAPETFKASRFSPESDQFSLAASLYEAISGKRAFPGDDAVAVAAKIAHETPEPIAASLGLPAAVDDVLARALAKLPEDRFTSCEAFGQALSDSLLPHRAASPAGEPAFVEAPGPTAGAASARDRDELPRERKTGQIVLGAVVVVTTAALLLRTALHSMEAPPPREPAEPARSSAPAPLATSAARPPRPPPRPTHARAEPTEHPSASASAPAPPAASASAPAAADAGPASSAAATSADAGAAAPKASR